MTHHDIIPSTVLLTGPTRGIGAAMLRHLVEHPSRPRLVLMGRNAETLAAAVSSASAAGVHAVGIRVDLADLATIDRAAQELAAAIDRGGAVPPNVVIANAGAQFGDRRGTSVQGYEQTFAVNVIAQHALLRAVEPLLAPGSHTVLMGSSTHRGRAQSFGLVPSPTVTPPSVLAQVDRSPGGATRQAGGRAYADSKLALVTLSHAWARRLAVSGQRLNTYDPGLVPGTGLGRTFPGYMRWTWEHVMPAMRVLPGASSPGNSGRRAVELALGDRHGELHDGYVEIGRVTRAGRRTFDLARQNELVDWLDAATDAFAPGAQQQRGAAA